MKKVDYKEMSEETCGTCRKRKIKKNVAMRTSRRPIECYKCWKAKKIRARASAHRPA